MQSRLIDPWLSRSRGNREKGDRRRGERAGVPRLVLDARWRCCRRTGAAVASAWIREDGDADERSVRGFHRPCAARQERSSPTAIRCTRRDSMQVSVAFAEGLVTTRPYPVSEVGSVRSEVFTRRGSLYFGVAHLLDFAAPLRSATSTGSLISTRGATRAATPAFQSAVTQVSGIPLTLDGDLLSLREAAVRRASPVRPETAVRVLSRDALDLDNDAIRHDLELGTVRRVRENSPLYARMLCARRSCQRQGAHHAPRCPDIELHGPKITRKLTTEWFAQRVDARYHVRACDRLDRMSGDTWRSTSTPTCGGFDSPATWRQRIATLAASRCARMRGRYRSRISTCCCAAPSDSISMAVQQKLVDRAARAATASSMRRSSRRYSEAIGLCASAAHWRASSLHAMPRLPGAATHMFLTLAVDRPARSSSTRVRRARADRSGAVGGARDATSVRRTGWRATASAPGAAERARPAGASIAGRRRSRPTTASTSTSATTTRQRIRRRRSSDRLMMRAEPPATGRFLVMNRNAETVTRGCASSRDARSPISAQRCGRCWTANFGASDLAGVESLIAARSTIDEWR